MPNSFSVGEVVVGSGGLFLIAGPCVIESEQHALKMAEAIAKVAADKNIPHIFKASYDKANRTSIRSFRGPGIAEGLRILGKVRTTVGVPVLTDVHEADDAARVAEVVDVLQIPAFLCRQTDLLVAAAKAGKTVNVKKGQFLSPWDMRHAVEKIREAGGEQVFLTERGSTFGYGNLVVDMRGLAIMRQFAPVVFDATHSVQLPSAGSGAGAAQQSGGQPEFIPLLARAAVAAGVDGVFIEVHDDPTNAKSDGANALDLKNLPELMDQLVAVHSALKR
jgi:2-dehydro-3-deoxyphosphooctonate aldolase (KDO 8-P synthase)